MPKIFEWQGYRFYFYSNEGNPPEPVHIHVRYFGDSLLNVPIFRPTSSSSS
ncbi:DUF4160 domain-containing protein [uncultured Parasphingorhabdus sp.]|uniref:DUF4160 domain-containing protein n=1 Tax=uncultured Parasphingorhabdus sp. TaxID=2709694 RepID=UPI0037491F24